MLHQDMINLLIDAQVKVASIDAADEAMTVCIIRRAFLYRNNRHAERRASGLTPYFTY